MGTEDHIAAIFVRRVSYPGASGATGPERYTLKDYEVGSEVDSPGEDVLSGSTCTEG